MKREVRERFRRECAEVFGEDMADYVVSKTSQVVEVHGRTVFVERRRIEKYFCFGYVDDYDGENYDRANRMALKAAASAEFFKDENMKAFRDDMEILLDNLAAIHREDALPHSIALVASYSKGNLGEVIARRAADVIEEAGPCFVRELPGKELPSGYIPTEEELLAIIGAYEAAMREHENKVNNYIKRYGTSKVVSWSYWRDE